MLRSMTAALLRIAMLQLHDGTDLAKPAAPKTPNPKPDVGCEVFWVQG